MDIQELYDLIRANLDKGIVTNSDEGIQKGDVSMPTRMREKVTVNGSIKWINGYSRQEVLDNYVKLLVQEGVVEMVNNDDMIPLFGDYYRTFYDTFKQDQQSNTVVNRERIARNHIFPVFVNRRMDRISTMEIQQWFNDLAKKYSHETILKIKNIMSPVFDAAVEDEILTRNPFASKRLKISGRSTVHHKAIPKDKMKEIKMEVKNLPDKERLMCGLLCYTGMRYEEILGLKWEDIEDGWIFVRRAVVHPNRNMPEVKVPKTKTSERMIPVVPELEALFNRKKSKGYILATDRDKKHMTPMSYTEARRIFDKIRKKFNISEYSAHDFRDTCATEWREKGMDLDMVARLLGHSKTETTEKRYVKYREDGVLEKARTIMST